MKISAPPPLVLAGLLLVGSCVSNDSTGIGDSTSSAAVFVQPAVVPSAADASALPINRIRTVTARHPDNAVLDDTVFTVDPQAVEWALDLSVSLVESPVTAHVFIHLIHDDGAGMRETQYSGVTDTMTIARGQSVETGDMPLVRGPLANLFVTGIEVTSLDAVAEGRTAELTADVTSSATSEPTVYWTSLNTTVLTIDGSTAFGVQPGLADVVATAGAVSDTATLEVSSAEPTDLNRWTNANGGLWSDPENWSTGSPASVGDSAVIDLQGVYQVTVDQNVDVQSLIVGAPSSVITVIQTADSMVVDNVLRIGDGGIYDLSGTGVLSGGGDILVDAGLLQWTGGEISNTGVLDIGETGGLEIDGTAQKDLNTPSTVIGGSMFWGGTGDLILPGGTSITVEASGVMSLDADAALFSSTPGTLDNLGTIQRSTSTGGAGVGGLVLNNSGTIDVQAGGLVFSDFTGTSSSDGSFVVAGDAILGIGSGTLTAAATVTGQGTVAFSDPSSTVTIEGSVDVDMVGMTTDGVSVTITGSYAAGTTFLGGSETTLTLSMQDTARTDVLAMSGGTLNGTAPVLVQQTFQWVGGALGGSGALVLEEGGYGELSQPVIRTSTKPLTIRGTLDILDGSLDQNGDFTLDPLAVVQGGGVLDLTDAIVLGWYGSTLPGTSPGRLQVLTPSNGLVLDPVSVVNIEIEGSTAGTGFDVLDFGGTVFFDGELDVDTLAGGFVPAPGDRFAVITVDGSRSGGFSSVTVPPLNGVSLDPVWVSGATADTLYLEATSHPLVFSSDRAGNGSLDLWTGSADGSSASQLTSTAATDQGAHWSPDGSRLLFTRDDGINELIWVMDDDGSNATQLSGAQSDHSYAEWSPDGSQIVFTNFDGISEDIWIMNSDGTSPTAITTDRQLNELMPSVSPANTLIAFVTNASGNRDIWRMNRDGTGQTEITTDPGDDEDPSWHPEGTQIVFSSLRNNATDIYVIGVDGSGETQLTANAGRNLTPVFSPDGTQIYFTSDRTGNSEIWVMDADGTNPRQVTDSPFFDGGPDVRN